MTPKIVHVVKLNEGVVISTPVGQGNLAAIFENQDQAHNWLGARNYVLAYAKPDLVGGDHISGTYVRLGGEHGGAH